MATRIENETRKGRPRLRWPLIAGLAILLAALGLGYLYSWLTGSRSHHDGERDLWFEDVTDEAGIQFVHDPGDVSRWFMPQIHGSGVAIFDFDGDGLLDIYLLNFGGPDSQSINRLYKNMGNGKFKDVTAGSGLGIAGYNTGVIVGDINNDGKPDVIVTQYGGVKVFLNLGNGKFEDATEESGVRNPLWGTSVNLFDYDRDGYLDLVIANFLEVDPTKECHGPTGKRDYCGPSVFRGTATKLFRNRGAELAREDNPKKPRVLFEDVTAKSGLASAPGPGLGVYCADFNGDGWPDIFIANDNKPNHLWINQKDGTFKEEALTRGIALDSMGQAQAGMGIAVGDIDGKGMFDLYVTHLASERNTLWQQGPRGMFTDRTARAGLLATDWRGTGFGTVLCDFDHDGRPDIAIANGAVVRGTPTPNSALGKHFQDYSERNQLFRNDGQGKFVDISKKNKPFCGTPNVARGLAYGDLNGDGALDLVLTTIGDRARVFRNVVRERGHWLIARAYDPRLNRDAYGAEVTVEAGGRQFLRVINPGDSYQSSSDPRAHFGIGASNKFDRIHVLWPDGLAEVFPGGDADRVLTLEYGKGKKK